MQPPAEVLSTEENQMRLYRWLIGPQAADYFQLISDWRGGGVSLPKIVQRLRRLGLDSSSANLLVTQANLRESAKNKFSYADRMFFEQTLLEQATDQQLANYKAHRFVNAPAATDYCCGLGGDLIALAQVTHVVGVDQSTIACLLANSNCHAYELEVKLTQSDVESCQFDESSWFHIDPDRRPHSKRTIQLKNFSPPLAELDRLNKSGRNGAIKLAPASQIPQSWVDQSEQQWIGDRHECKQQVVWFGEAAEHPGRRVATALDSRGEVLFHETETSRPIERVSVAEKISSFLFEPHPTVIAAGLVDEIGQRNRLQRIKSDIAYLVGEQPTNHRGLTQFRILEVTKLNMKTISEALRAYDCGMLEVKQRGVGHDLLMKYSAPKFHGSRRLTLVLTRTPDRHVAMICQRL